MEAKARAEQMKRERAARKAEELKQSRAAEHARVTAAKARKQARAEFLWQQKAEALERAMRKKELKERSLRDGHALNLMTAERGEWRKERIKAEEQARELAELERKKQRKEYHVQVEKQLMYNRKKLEILRIREAEKKAAQNSLHLMQHIKTLQSAIRTYLQQRNFAHETAVWRLTMSNFEDKSIKAKQCRMNNHMHHLYDDAALRIRNRDDGVAVSDFDMWADD